jgi:hypothetical protein
MTSDDWLYNPNEWKLKPLMERVEGFSGGGQVSKKLYEAQKTDLHNLGYTDEKKFREFIGDAIYWKNHMIQTLIIIIEQLEKEKPKERRIKTAIVRKGLRPGLQPRDKYSKEEADRIRTIQNAKEAIEQVQQTIEAGEFNHLQDPIIVLRDSLKKVSEVIHEGSTLGGIGDLGEDIPDAEQAVHDEDEGWGGDNDPEDSFFTDVPQEPTRRQKAAAKIESLRKGGRFIAGMAKEDAKRAGKFAAGQVTERTIPWVKGKWPFSRKKKK